MSPEKDESELVEGEDYSLDDLAPDENTPVKGVEGDLDELDGVEEEEKDPDSQESEPGIELEESEEMVQPGKGTEAEELVAKEEKEVEEEVIEEPVKKVEPGKEVTEEDTFDLTEKDAIFKVRGKEVKASELTNEQKAAYITKGMRFEERMGEMNTYERNLVDQVNREREILAKGAEALKDLRTRGVMPGGEPGKVTYPKELEPSEDDDESTAQVKTIGRQMFDQAQILNEQVEASKSSMGEAEAMREGQAMLDEITLHTEDFIGADPDTVIAVKALYPNLHIKDIVQKSHELNVSDERLELIFKARPELEKQLKEKHINEYLAKKGQARKVKARKSGSTRVTAKEKKPVLYDFDVAETEALKSFERREASEEEEI